MFRGVTTLNLDTKGRMAMPSRYRERLASLCEGQLVITVDKDRCLLLYPLPEWIEIERKLSQLPDFDPKIRALKRLYIGYATEFELDSHGRILLPSSLREFAALDKRLVLVGQGNKFELWSEPVWNERRDAWLNEAASAEGGLPSSLESFSL